jgi:GNAT superfamily N-acetyltransferase
MLIELAADRRGPLRPLFAGLTGCRGILDAALEGTMGRAWADDESSPAVGLIDLDFYLLAGDPDAPAAEVIVRALEAPWSAAVSSDAWGPLLHRVWGGMLATRTRVDFEAGQWKRARLQEFVDALPEGFELRRITLDDAARFRELTDSLVYNFPSLEEFVERGAGFGIEHEGRFVTGCSSFALSSRKLEFEIQTHPDFRRRGLATAAAAAMILYCIEQGLEPCWDAHNPISAALATKLGFVDATPYTAYEVMTSATRAVP